MTNKQTEQIEQIQLLDSTVRDTLAKEHGISMNNNILTLQINVEDTDESFRRLSIVSDIVYNTMVE